MYPSQIEASVIYAQQANCGCISNLLGYVAWLDEMKTSGEFSGKSGDLTVLHQPQGIKAKRLVAVGGGKKAKFDSAALRKARELRRLAKTPFAESSYCAARQRVGDLHGRSELRSSGGRVHRFH